LPIREIQVEVDTSGNRSSKYSKILFHGPWGSRRQLGPMPSMVGKGFVNISFRNPSQPEIVLPMDVFVNPCIFGSPIHTKRERNIKKADFSSPRWISGI
jgi:hypothetical protein